MLKPAGSYSMTDVGYRGGRSRENRKATTGFGARPLPVRKPDRVFGKKVVHRQIGTRTCSLVVLAPKVAERVHSNWQSRN